MTRCITWETSNAGSLFCVIETMRLPYARVPIGGVSWSTGRRRPGAAESSLPTTRLLLAADERSPSGAGGLFNLSEEMEQTKDQPVARRCSR